VFFYYYLLLIYSFLSIILSLFLTSTLLSFWTTIIFPFIVELFVIYKFLLLLNVPSFDILSLKKSNLSIDFIFYNYFALFNVKNDFNFGAKSFFYIDGLLFSFKSTTLFIFFYKEWFPYFSLLWTNKFFILNTFFGDSPSFLNCNGLFVSKFLGDAAGEDFPDSPFSFPFIVSVLIFLFNQFNCGAFGG